MANHPAILTLRFALELAMLAAYGMLGWQADSGWLRFVLAIGLPLLAAGLWGLFVSPKATIAAPGVIRLLIEALLFAGAVWALAIASGPAAALIFGALVLLHEAAGYDRIMGMLR